MGTSCSKTSMAVYDVEDYTKAKSTHLSVNKESAVQAHLMHYGLLYISGWIKVVRVRELREVKNRDTVCWDSHCCLVVATEYK